MSDEKPEQKCHRCGPILPRKGPCQQPLCPLEQNAAPQEVETYGVSSASPGPLAVTDEESTRPAGAAPETGAGDYKLQYLKQELKNSGDPRIIVAIGEIENQAATIAALRREVEEYKSEYFRVHHLKMDAIEARLTAERELAALKRGEFICKRCGIRKDGEIDQPIEF